METSSINDVCNYIVEKIKKLIELSEYEEGILRNAMMLPYATVTNAKSVLSDRIDDAIRSKADINYMICRIRDKQKVIKVPYEVEYNKMFTILTRQNRPSKQAIDSEIKYTKKEMADTSKLIDEYDEVINYLQGLHSVIDLVIRNSENRRYNL